MLEFFGQEAVARVVRNHRSCTSPSRARNEFENQKERTCRGAGFFARLAKSVEGLRQLLDLGHREGASRDRVRERDQLDDREVLEAEEGDGGDHPPARGSRRAADEAVEASWRRSTADLSIAVETNQDDLAVVLIQKKNALEQRGRASSRRDLDTAQKDADSAKSSLMTVQGEIKKLKAEKDNMLAKMAVGAGAHPHPGTARRASRSTPR